MNIRWPWRHASAGGDLTCREAVALMTAYLDDALAAGDRVRLERHLDDCVNCGEHLQQIRATIRVAGEVRAEDLDPLAREDLLELYRRWATESGIR